SDGAQNCHFFPGQYYDYNYSLMLARRDAGLKDSLGRDLDTLIGVKRGAARCSTPTNDGGIIKLPGDFREIQGTLWFHDHRISYTSENVYKGFAALLEYFSGTDRGYERPLPTLKQTRSTCGCRAAGATGRPGATAISTSTWPSRTSPSTVTGSCASISSIPTASSATCCTSTTSGSRRWMSCPGNTASAR